MTAQTKLWGGRFACASSPELSRFSRSDPRYFVMAPYDLHGSRAHVRELNRSGLISDAELTDFINVLKTSAATSRPVRLNPRSRTRMSTRSWTRSH